jgi:hypothetical protein
MLVPKIRPFVYLCAKIIYLKQHWQARALVPLPLNLACVISFKELDCCSRRLSLLPLPGYGISVAILLMLVRSIVMFELILYVLK